MYTIDKSQFGAYDHFKISDSQNIESISIIPAFGGLINDWTVNAKSGVIGLLQNYSDAQELESKIDTNFQGPKLIPYPNRIKGGRYAFDAEEYQFEHCKFGEPNSIHGFLFRLRMSVVDIVCAADHASITMKHSYNGSIQGYPFFFDLELTYQLHETKGLSMHTKIRNTGETNMPIGDGWHPYLTYREGIDVLELEFHAKNKLEMGALGIPTGNVVPYKTFNSLRPIDDAVLDDCFELEDDQILLRYPDEDLTLRFWQEMGNGKYNFLQVYTPDDRASIALEPMTCAPNAFNSGKGLIELAPNETIDLSHGVQILRQ